MSLPSPFVYQRRHRRRALLLTALICLATLGVGITVGVLDSFLEYSGSYDHFLTRFSMVSARGAVLDPSVVSQIGAHPDVARVIPEKSLDIVVPIVQRGFDLFGVPEADLQVLLHVCNLRLKEGRLLRTRTNEAVLSEELADALGLRVGDRLGRSVDEGAFGGIPTNLVLVGIVEGAPSAGRGSALRLGFVSYEYLESHDLYASQPTSLIVVPQEGRKDAVDHFLETTIAPLGTSVSTYRQSAQDLAQALLFIHLTFGVVDGVVAVVIALAVAMIHQIALTQRTAEFGLLHALGIGRGRLIRQLALETVALVGVGWLAGLALLWLILAWLKVYVYAPRGMGLNLTNVTPIWFSVLIPVAAVAFVTLSIVRVLTRLDAVAIIERGKLSTEAIDRRRPVRRSMMRPLSTLTFYVRHRRRGLAQVLIMALLIPGVALPIFVLSPMSEMNKLFFERLLERASLVSPQGGDGLAPSLTAQLRTDPAVARLVPAVELGLLVTVPPVNRTYAPIYAVPAEDLEFLVELYGLEVEDGRLPASRSNEVVLSESMAVNRSLGAGDKVGLPVYGMDYRLPTEMVVAGVLSQSRQRRGPGALWAGFASYEYVRDHEAYSSQPVSLLVIPAEGRKAELDAWLEQSVASDQVAVLTHEAWLRRHRQDGWRIFVQFAVIESMVAAVAAIALAVLSYVFYGQRREEFGTLHALGHSRRWLVRRTVRETVTVAALAWLLGAAVCLAGLVYIQTSVYAPKGLSLDLFSPAPWLFTLPMPLAVVAVSASLVAQMLSRLDPVSVIERRG
jgi:ABC-type lipoprotein release transport system permease subunit